MDQQDDFEFELIGDEIPKSMRAHHHLPSFIDSLCNVCGTDIMVLREDAIDMTKHVCWRCREEQAKGPQCECGAVKAGTQYHAYWCNLYTDPMKSKEIK